jgi:hypothetical protein
MSTGFYDDLTTTTADDVDAASPWEPVDLTDALTGRDIPPPTILARTDGTCLLYPGRVHWLFSEPEGCKTWTMLVAATQVLLNGDRVLWVDFEDDDRGIVARLRALGLADRIIGERFVYLRPDEALYDRHGRALTGCLTLERILAERIFALSVIDGVSEAMQTEGLDPMENPDVARWMRRLPRRIANTGAAVGCLDHVVKDREGRGRYAIGGQHKLAGVTGSAYRLDVVRPLARALGGEPTTGIVTLTVTKDRPGYVRGGAVGDRVATMELTAYPDGGISVALMPPDTAPAPDLALCRRIADYLTQYDGASKNAIERDVEGKAERIREALQWMANADRVWVRIEKVGVAHRHYLTDLGQETFG